jgi:lipopolysaccharide biosynthesis regulator YciM
MKLLGDSEEIRTVQASAALTLLTGYASTKDYPKGLEVFQNLGKLGESEDVSIVFAQACVVMAGLAIENNEVEEAKNVFTIVSRLVEAFPDLWTNRDEVFSIIYAATGIKDL